ncbi:MAG: hypothetical protein K9J37_12625 [Saprospiraceae bacterium]|nr:hypothetical protein [Saprospiraceae bacterium]MCF8250756.1 hypothetical protein [Saprospiraceae bacterium]MCF8282168.1 hypothetical protein [Bacteroidales bacterium]MCF8312557.1 hypothetical protein [Saprospiraceae bacterium]MCF8440886.1 hypothetical protein [Saprospiraceae bacterium]
MIFKAYEQEQKINSPVNVSEMVPPGHLSRTINEVVERIPMEKLAVYYAGGGTGSYQPKMMIKVWLYGYCERVYTSRRLAMALRGDIKHNMQHSRFILREKKKVHAEYGLLSIGHNLRKVYCEKSGCWAAY